MSKVLDLEELVEEQKKLRKEVILMSHKAKAAHLASSLSCLDLLLYIYKYELNLSLIAEDAENRPRFILSKGHAASALYATLAHVGLLEQESLATYCQEGSQLTEHPCRNGLKGIEYASGSLGHGLSVAVGMSLASRLSCLHFPVYVLMSDGECNEGSVWEAAMMAAAQNLDQLMVFVDFNGWQATGRTRDVLALEPLEKKFESFGFAVERISGHCFSSIHEAVQRAKKQNKPQAIIANTIKGKGVSFMEDNNHWHYRIPSEEELLNAYAEIDRS